MDTWEPTRAAGLRRLANFVPKAGRDYAKLRNYDLGPGRHEHVSTLSPWIKHRLILEEEVIQSVLQRHSFAAAEKLIQEVFWRTYWKGWLELRRSVWQDYREQVRRLTNALDHDHDLRSRWEEASEGRTGIDCFDAWSRELIDTGYLHNHARMWFASIWIFTLDLPWELGADFFLRHLLDGDPASNTLSWRWVAGLQTRGTAYLARPDNIARYTEGRFDPGHRLARVARPLDGPAPPAPSAPPEPAHWDANAPTGLLLTEEDLHPAFLFHDRAQFRGVAILQATERRSPLAVAPRVTNFVDGALRDALDRLANHGQGLVGPAHETDSVDAIVAWANELSLRQIVTAYVPTGPTSDVIENLGEKLADHNIALVPVLREWDRRAWPHATRGFFQFREKIPRILAQVQDAASPAV